MGRNENSEVKAIPRPVKARQKRGRNKAAEYKPQIVTIIYNCIFCNQTFENTNFLFDHMRRVHPNLCDIPQITADSEIIEEISGRNNNNNKKSLAKVKEDERSVARRSVIESSNAAKLNANEDKYLSEDEMSLDHLIEMVGSDDEGEAGVEEDEEEIESPPYEPNSDDGVSNSSQAAVEKGSRDEILPADNEGMDGEDDEEDDYCLIEPICEIMNCNESETEEFQTKLQESIKLNKAVAPRRGRRRDYNEDCSDVGAGEGFFQCTQCNKSFPYAGELARHVRSHTLNKPYQCAICDKAFTHIGSLNTHLRIHTGVKPYRCEKCDKAFTQSSSLLVHLRSHQSKKKQFHVRSQKEGSDELLPCPKCDKKFKHETILNEHIRVHTEQNLFQCSICRLQFASGSDLVQHLKCHTGDKPFQCSICGKSFTQPGSLSTHTRTHTGERPHSCPHPNCDKSFTQASSLSVHQKIHSPEKPFWCHICERSYSQQAYFNKHMSYHQQDKFAPCPLCNAVIFDAGKQLVKHFNKYHYDKQDKVFLCSICNVRFEDPQLLIGHVKVHFEKGNGSEGKILEDDVAKL